MVLSRLSPVTVKIPRLNIALTAGVIRSPSISRWGVRDLRFGARALGWRRIDEKNHWVQVRRDMVEKTPLLDG
jgi:hypothetical protein